MITWSVLRFSCRRVTMRRLLDGDTRGAGSGFVGLRPDRRAVVAAADIETAEQHRRGCIPVGAMLAMTSRTSGSSTYSGSPGHSVAAQSRWPEMLATDFCTPLTGLT